MLQVSYTAIRQMYNAYKQRSKFYVDWQSSLSHGDVNTAQVVSYLVMRHLVSCIV